MSDELKKAPGMSMSISIHDIPDILNGPRHELAVLLRRMAIRQQNPEILQWANAVADIYDPTIPDVAEEASSDGEASPR